MANTTFAQPETGLSDYFSNVRREIEPLLPRAPETVLEIGCGAGGTMAWLRGVRPVRYAAGAEMNPDAGAAAKSVFDAVEIGDVNVARLDFAVERFDLILALDVLEHLSNPDVIVRRLCGKLAPGGVMIASIPNVGHYEVAWPLFFQGQWNYQDEGILDRTHLRFFSETTARQLFEVCGMSVGSVLYNQKVPNAFAPLGLSGSKGRWYTQKVIRALPFLPRHLFVSQFLIAASKQAA